MKGEKGYKPKELTSYDLKDLWAPESKIMDC